MFGNSVLFSVILLLLILAHATPAISDVWVKSSISQNLLREYKAVSENNYNFTIRIVDLLGRYDNQGLSFKILFPNNTESIILIYNSTNFINKPGGLYHIKPNHNYILTNTSYFYINENNQLINIGYVNYSNLIMKTFKQNLTIEKLESQIAELASDYSELKNIFVRNLYTNILNIQHLSIFTYIALTIAIISIIFTAVNTRRTLNRLKRIEEYIKNIIEDTEIE
jgi:hypothetical protein